MTHRDRVTTSSRCGSPGEGDSGFVQGSRLLWAHGKREFLNGSATGLLHRPPRFPQEPVCGKGGGGEWCQERKRNKESRNLRIKLVILPDLSSFSAVSTGPFSVLVSRELPKSTDLFPMVFHHLQTTTKLKVSKVFCALASSTFPGPIAQASPLSGFCSSRSPWFSAPISCFLAFPPCLVVQDFPPFSVNYFHPVT